MARDLDVEMLIIFADQRGRAIDSLNRSIGTGTVVVNDEVSFVVSDGEGASAQYQE
jgi:hypothetical protein